MNILIEDQITFFHAIDPIDASSQILAVDTIKEWYPRYYSKQENWTAHEKLHFFISNLM